MPTVAIGTWEYGSKDVFAAISGAVKAGMTHVDTANNYKNQQAVGDAIRASTLREKIFLTTKVPGCSEPDVAGCYASTQADIIADMEQLGFRNVDLLLLHFPPRPFPWRPKEDCARLRAQWRALEEAYDDGRARAIGVSNLCPSCLECLRSSTDPPLRVFPAVNQVQFHIGMGTDPGGIVSYAAAHGLVLQAYSPLGDGRSRELISGPLVSKIGELNGRTGPQVSLKYVLQLGWSLVTKSTSAFHLAEDIDLFGWTLSPAHMAELTTATAPFANYSFACVD